MSKGMKLKFDRDSNLVAKYVAVTKSLIGDGFKESEIGTLTYSSNGKVVLSCEGFEHTIEMVDELDIAISPMDSIFSKATFKIKKMDDSVTTLPHKFYGVRGTNILINYDNELSGVDDIADGE